MRTPNWESSAGALTALLNSGQPLNKADLYEIQLASGDVLRWTSAEVALSAAGQLWQLGPGIERSQCKWVVGVEVDSLTLSLFTDAARPVAVVGIPLLAFINAGGFAGATVTLYRAFWGVGGSAPVGLLLWFRGKVSEVPELDRDHAQLVVKSALEQLNVKVPRQVYQAQCLATVYDTDCGAVRNSFTSLGAATGPTTNGRTQLPTNVTQPAGFFDLGTLQFISGANAGVSRSIKSHGAGGAIALLSPLPGPVLAGDSFYITPGCDGRLSTCTTRFNNRARFKGQPHIPQPETVT